MAIGATTPTGARGARLRAAFLLAACALMAALAVPPAAYAGLYDMSAYDADGNLLESGSEVDADTLMRGITVKVDCAGNPVSASAAEHSLRVAIICDQTGEDLARLIWVEVESDNTVNAATWGFRRPVMPGYTYTLQVHVLRGEPGISSVWSGSPEVAYAEFGFSVGGGTGDGSGEDDGSGDGGAPGDGESSSGEGTDGEGQPNDSPDGSGGGASSAEPEPDSEGPDQDTASEAGADEGGASEVDGADDASAPQHQATSPAQSASQPNAAQAALQAVRRQAEAVSEGDSRTGDPAAAEESSSPAARAADADAAAASAQPGGGTTWRLVGTSPGGSPAQNAASGLNLEVTGIPRLWLALCLLLALAAPAGAATRALLARRRTTAPSRLAL